MWLAVARCAPISPSPVTGRNRVINNAFEVALH
jgi:hypothetical protein